MPIKGTNKISILLVPLNIYLSIIHTLYFLATDVSIFFNDRKNSPNPPIASTKITIKSNDVIVLKLKRIDDITPNISPVIEPSASIQPKTFLLL